MSAVAISAADSQQGNVDLATTKSLKRSLEKEFSEAVSPISVLETFYEIQPGNLSAQSLREMPLRPLNGLMVAQDIGVIGQALRGRPLTSSIVAQAGEKTPPRM